MSKWVMPWYVIYEVWEKISEFEINNFNMRNRVNHNISWFDPEMCDFEHIAERGNSVKNLWYNNASSIFWEILVIIEVLKEYPVIDKIFHEIIIFFDWQCLMKLKKSRIIEAGNEIDFNSSRCTFENVPNLKIRLIM
jgi:hypothetical protein